MKIRPRQDTREMEILLTKKIFPTNSGFGLDFDRIREVAVELMDLLDQKYEEGKVAGREEAWTWKPPKHLR